MNITNKNITFQGNPLTILGKELSVGATLPAFTLTGNDMGDVKNDQFKGKALVLSVIPSLDTPVCSIQTKKFNSEASQFAGAATILTVSRDLPFAQKRWCGAEGVSNVVTASDYKYRTFGESFGVLISEWQLLCRAIFVADSAGKLIHVEYVKDVSSEPEYQSVLTKLQSLVS